MVRKTQDEATHLLRAMHTQRVVIGVSSMRWLMAVWTMLRIARITVQEHVCLASADTCLDLGRETIPPVSEIVEPLVVEVSRTFLEMHYSCLGVFGGGRSGLCPADVKTNLINALKMPRVATHRGGAHTEPCPSTKGSAAGRWAGKLHSD